MSYFDPPTPVTNQAKVTDPNKSTYLSPNGELLQLETKEQAMKKARILLKNFKWEEWIAQKICRFNVAGKDHLFAYIIRDFSPNHDRTDLSNISDTQMWFGRSKIMVPRKKTDVREHSETLGKRIDVTEDVQYGDGSIRPMPVLGEIGYYYYCPVNDEMVKNYKKLVGMFPKGESTELLFVLQNGSRVITSHNADDFWKHNTTEAQDVDKKRASIFDDMQKGKVLESNAATVPPPNIQTAK